MRDRLKRDLNLYLNLYLYFSLLAVARRLVSLAIDGVGAPSADSDRSLVCHVDPPRLSHHHHEGSKHEEPAPTKPHQSKGSGPKKAAHGRRKGPAPHDDHESHDQAG